MDQEEKTEQGDANSLPIKRLGLFARSARRRSERRSDPGRMPADVLAKLIISAVTILLFLGLLISFILPSSQEPGTKMSIKSYEGKLEYARKLCREGKVLIMKAAQSSGSAKTRNGLFEQAEDVLWESREVYSELIDAHDEEGYGYLQTEIEDVQACIYHCQKTRTIVEFN